MRVLPHESSRPLRVQKTRAHKESKELWSADNRTANVRRRRVLHLVNNARGCRYIHFHYEIKAQHLPLRRLPFLCLRLVPINLAYLKKKNQVLIRRYSGFVETKNYVIWHWVLLDILLCF